MGDWKKLGGPEANEIIIREGWFHGLNTLIRKYGLPPDRVAVHKANFFKLLYEKVVEGEKELQRLSHVLSRMKANCSDGMLPRPREGNDAYGSASGLFRQNLKVFDGWVISLLETHLSILCAAENPETAAMRLKDLRESFRDLWNVRMDHKRPFQNHPELFQKPYIYIK